MGVEKQEEEPAPFCSCSPWLTHELLPVVPSGFPCHCLATLLARLQGDSSTPGSLSSLLWSLALLVIRKLGLFWELSVMWQLPPDAFSKPVSFLCSSLELCGSGSGIWGRFGNPPHLSRGPQELGEGEGSLGHCVVSE